MKTLKFSVHIAAPREKVWDILWSDESYKKWAAVFQEGAYAVSDWKEGSKIVFMRPGGEGMTSLITRKVHNEIMSFKHLNTVKHGIENQTGQLGSWDGAVENFYLSEFDSITELKVEVDAPDEAVKYFESNFPLALKKIKELSEVPHYHKVY